VVVVKTIVRDARPTDIANPQTADTAAQSAKGQTAERCHSQAPRRAPANIIATDARRLVGTGLSLPSIESPTTRVNVVVSTFGVKPGTASVSAVTL
jgi:hypothetical protein